MTTYNPNIPQPTDIISNSQSDILDNFIQLNTQFAIDHTAFNTGSGNGDGFHKKATMPNTASVTPGSGYGTYYTSKTGTAGAAITEAVYKSGDATAISILSAVKAWGVFTTTVVADGFNFASVTNPSTGNYVITLTNALSSTNYSVLVSVPLASNWLTGGIAGTAILSTSSFQINVRSLTNTSSGSSAAPISFVVLQS